MKRAFDIVASSVGLTLVAPFVALSALLVRLDSDGPAFFRQERIGRDFRPFKILKLRSMAEQKVTRVGRVLRRYKLDELPQLWNVLRGEMSLVGPRPELRRYVELYRRDYEELLRVRPGLTDLASLRFRAEGDVLALSRDPEREYVERILPQKLALSKDSIRRSGLLFDLSVILRTLIGVVQ